MFMDSLNSWKKTLAKRAKEDQAKQAKVARAEARKSAHASANEFGATICAGLTCAEDVLKLKLPDMKAALTYRLTWLRTQLQLPPLLSLEKKILEKKIAATTRKSGS